MKRFLVLLILAIVLVGGGLFWLAQQAVNNPPHSGEQVIEVDIDV